jgi:phosphonoacetaldehyde methylase
MTEIKRVMLIYPPITFAPQNMKQCHLPLGIAYIAAVLRDQVELKVLDATIEGWDHEEQVGGKLIRYGLSFSEIEKRIIDFKPDLVGLSCISSTQFRNVADLAKRIKNIDPDIFTITGGTHPTFMTKECMKQAPHLDMIGRGEGEFIMRDVVNFLNEGKSLSGIPGLAFRENDRVVINEDRKPFENLDEIPFPARDLFPFELYSKVGMPMGTVYRKKPFMNLITSRGCPYFCTFCSSTNFWGNCYRKRSPENVLAEMEELYNKYGVREFKFFDDNITSDRKRAEAIFQGMIDRGIDVKWNTPNGIHVVTLDEELLTLMKKSGCYEITMAVESGDKDVLRKIIRKPTKLERVLEVSKLTRKLGITTNSFFIIGFPGETMEQINRTLEFSKTLDLDRMSFFIFQPLPGTRLFDVCVEKGYIDPAIDRENLDYYEGHFDTPEWTGQQLHDIRKNWVWRYNASLIFRHPIRFFKNYLILVTRPKYTLEILSRVIRN